MTIKTHSEEINNEAFIKAYSHSIACASSDELRTFLDVVAVRGDYSALDGGNHMYDCWSLWNYAREPLTKDLKAAIQEHLELSSNYTVNGLSHQFNKFDKLAELGEVTPEWINAMNIKAVLEQLLVYGDDELVTVGVFNFNIREKIKSISTGQYGDGSERAGELIAALVKLAGVAGDDFVISSPAGTFTIRQKLIELGSDQADDMDYRASM